MSTSGASPRTVTAWGPSSPPRSSPPIRATSASRHTRPAVLLDGIHLDGIPTPSVAEARRIQTPYQWHHGLRDFAVPFLLDERFDSVLTAPHEGYLYRRLGHGDAAKDAEVLERIRPGTPRTACSDRPPPSRLHSHASCRTLGLLRRREQDGHSCSSRSRTTCAMGACATR